MTELTYIAIIQGDRAPFKWKVERRGGLGPQPFTPNGCSGEGQTYDAALLAACEAADEAEAKRRHENTVKRETILTVDLDPPAEVTHDRFTD